VCRWESRAANPNWRRLKVLMQDLPQLEHLGVRGLRGSPSALRGLTPPVCRLVSCGELCRARRFVEIERDGAERVGRGRRGQDPLKMCAIRHVYVTSRNTRTLAALPQHFPSIRTYAFRTPSRRVDSSRSNATVRSESDAVVADRIH
jgi:hypothetical protein